MRTEGVAFVAPPSDDCLSLSQCVEDLPIQHFVSELAVETFTVAIFQGAPESDVEDLRSCSLEPLAHELSGRF